jgi:hypothetical protein
MVTIWILKSGEAQDGRIEVTASPVKDAAPLTAVFPIGASGKQRLLPSYQKNACYLIAAPLFWR